MIFVTGVPRSGTSLVTQILARHGLATGLVNEYFENVVLVGSVVKPMLIDAGADPLGQHDFPAYDALPDSPGLREAMTDEIGENGVFKDCKLALVWPVFAKAFPEAKWVIVRRDRQEIVSSCLRAPFMTAHGSNRAAWLRWVEEYEQRLADLKADADTITIRPRDVIEDPAAFEPVAAFCGLAFDASHARAAIRDNLFRREPCPSAA